MNELYLLQDRRGQYVMNLSNFETTPDIQYAGIFSLSDDEVEIYKHYKLIRF